VDGLDDAIVCDVAIPRAPPTERRSANTLLMITKIVASMGLFGAIGAAATGAVGFVTAVPGGRQ
jgi:hypothetical protein